MFVLVLDVELRLPGVSSLKGKRSVIKHLTETARLRYRVAAAEVGFQELWQRSRLGFVAVSGSAQHTSEVIGEVERFVWSHPEIEMLRSEQRWVADDEA